ncbi:MAG: DJ-1/PfpI family protein [Bacteroidota bacterium]
MKELVKILLAILMLSTCQKAKKSINTNQTAEKITEDDSLKMVEMAEDFKPENHFEVMETFFGKPKHDIQSIGILVYDGVNELDFMGPRYVLGQSMGVKTELIAINAGNVKTVMGVEIVPDNVIDSVNQLDILVIPGGFKGTIEAAYDDKLHEWIRKIDKKTTYTAAVCTGVWVLGATGLLKGKKATTNWYEAEEMLKKYEAKFTNERFTQDGKYWTSAGVTAGMDMSLAIMKEIWGEKYTQAVMLDMEYDPAPPIQGGSPEKTESTVYQMMKSMYAMGITPLIDSLENNKSVVN